MAPTTPPAAVLARPGAARLALAHPPDHEDGGAPEHPGDGARPRRRHLLRRRLGEPRGARRVPTGLPGDRQRPRDLPPERRPTPPRSATWRAASRSRASRRTSSACRGSAPSTSPSGSAAPSSPTTCSARWSIPGDTVMLLDPTYANYEGQLAFVAPGCADRAAAGARPGDVDVSAGDRPRRRGPRLHAALRPAPAEAGALRRARQPDQPGRAAGAGRADARAHRGSRARGWRSTSPTSARLRDAAGLLRLVAGRPSARDRHPLELEVGARAGTAAGLDRGGHAGDRRRSSGCSSAASCAPTRSRR